MNDTATAPAAPQVKMVQWFDDHFYKIKYTQGQCPTCKKPRPVYYLKLDVTCQCSPDGSGVLTSAVEMELTEFFPSVTTKLNALAKPFLTMWYGDLGTREAQLRKMEAAQRGTQTHHAWQMFTQNGLVVFNDERRPVYTYAQLQEFDQQYDGRIAVLRTQEQMYDMTKLQRFYAEIKPKEMLAEHTLFSLSGRDAGTCDNVFSIDAGMYKIAGRDILELPKGRYIFDLKTGKQIGSDARMQVSRYAKMHEEMGLGPIAGALIGHTQAQTRTGIEGFTTIYIPRNEIESYNDDYQHVAHMWNREFGSMKPTVFELPTLITLRQAKENA